MNKELKELLNNASTPYYKYRVAAILVCKDGNNFKGVNVETSSPAAGVCAERNALYAAISDGYKKGDFKELHVMTDHDEAPAPCFICRQALEDYTDEDMPIYLYSKNGLQQVLKVKELTPYPFNEGDLK